MDNAPCIYLETSHTARTNSRTGIQSVVRGLISGMIPHTQEVYPLRWSFRKDALTLLKPDWEKNLGLARDSSLWLPPKSLLKPRYLNYRTPIHRHPQHRSKFKERWLVLPELMEGQHVRRIREYAKPHGMRLCGIFHDAIAWRHPEVVRHWTRKQHAEYMMSLADLDLIIAVSKTSARHFQEFAELIGFPSPPLHVCPLAAEVSGQPRETQNESHASKVVKILCVSTLEPRKNHLRLLEAFQSASSRTKNSQIELHLVGAPYEWAPEILEAVQPANHKNPAIHWHGSVDSNTLRAHYRDCDFTVFASSLEGFGMPVMESLWFGKPCLCSNQGVMAENAVGGGCLTVNMDNTNELADALLQLAEQPGLRRELTAQAIVRPLKTWSGYAEEILSLLKSN
jgi:glycosyltransferase involved in cell wall biosynthesis